MKIINGGWPRENEVLIGTMSITYRQPNDNTEKDEDGQTLTISTRDSGGGKFLHFRTDGWSVDSDDLEVLTKHFTSMLDNIIND